MKANPDQHRWNGDEWTTLAIRNKPDHPSTSWWLDLDREQFQEAVKREAPRLAGSPVRTPKT